MVIEIWAFGDWMLYSKVVVIYIEYKLRELTGLK